MVSRDRLARSSQYGCTRRGYRRCYRARLTRRTGVGGGGSPGQLSRRAALLTRSGVTLPTALSSPPLVATRPDGGCRRGWCRVAGTPAHCRSHLSYLRLGFRGMSGHMICTGSCQLPENFFQSVL